MLFDPYSPFTLPDFLFFQLLPAFLLFILILGFHCCLYTEDFERTAKKGLLLTGIFQIVTACLYVYESSKIYKFITNSILYTNNLLFYSFYLNAEAGLYLIIVSVCLLILSGLHPLTCNLQFRFVRTHTITQRYRKLLMSIPEKEKLALIILNSTLILEIFLVTTFSAILGIISIAFIFITIILSYHMYLKNPQSQRVNVP
jgi:hypothetical protein